jgi:hypothetical protein
MKVPSASRRFVREPSSLPAEARTLIAEISAFRKLPSFPDRPFWVRFPIHTPRQRALAIPSRRLAPAHRLLAAANGGHSRRVGRLELNNVPSYSRRLAREPSSLLPLASCFQTSNRLTPKKLKLTLTYTKQSLRLISNRHTYAFFVISNRHCFSHFRNASLPLLADHCPLTPDHCISNRQSLQKLESGVTHTKQKLGCISNRLDFAFFTFASHSPLRAPSDMLQNSQLTA